MLQNDKQKDNTLNQAFLRPLSWKEFRKHSNKRDEKSAIATKIKVNISNPLVDETQLCPEVSPGV